MRAREYEFTRHEDWRGQDESHARKRVAAHRWCSCLCAMVVLSLLLVVVCVLWLFL